MVPWIKWRRYGCRSHWASTFAEAGIGSVKRRAETGKAIEKTDRRDSGRQSRRGHDIQENFWNYRVFVSCMNMTVSDYFRKSVEPT